MKPLQQVCYRLPWTQKDNPNGWIEPTTVCQLNCPGCYRGVDKETHRARHFKLEDLKEQVDQLVEERNIQTLSIAGGEPLLYPELAELISYACNKGLRTMIYTNGIGLDDDYLEKLKRAGATQVVIHIDKFQGRTGTNSNDELIQLRRNYCELFRRIGGINLGFIQPLTKDCLRDLPQLTEFFTHNRDIISLVVFTLYREICWDHVQKPLIDTSITMEDVLDALKANKVYRPASWLRSTLRSNEPAWVFSYSIGSAKRILGFLDKKVYRLIQEKYYARKQKHLFISSSYRVKITGLLKLFHYPSIFRILVKQIIFPGRKLFFQTYLVIRGPEKVEDTWDLCEGCPDAMWVDGKLEPSCILEDILKQKQN